MHFSIKYLWTKSFRMLSNAFEYINLSIRKHTLSFLFITLTTVVLLHACQSDTNKSSGEDKDMAAVLDSVRVKMNNPKNIFDSESKLAHCDSLLAMTTDPTQRLFLEFDKAGYLLECGKETESVALYEKLLGNGEDSIIRKNVLPKLGMAYLRLGERVNCVGMHNSDACIMPIRGNGVHLDKEGAQKAITTFQAVLEEYPENLEARWLLNISYMTIGRYPGSVPKEWLIPGLADPNSVKVQPFIDIAVDLGISVEDQAGGVIVDDFDNDGFLDIVTSAWGLDEPMHFFHNNGDGTFTDKSKTTGLVKITGGLNMTHTDYNNDGFNDIFVLRGGWWGYTGFGKQPNSLLRNNGDGTFTDVTIEAGMLSFHPTQTATWNDFNQDGWLDVFIGNETSRPDEPHPCELFINNQNGTFTDIFKANDFIITGFVKGVISGDYDNDNLPDIFFSTMDGGKVLLHNLGVKDKMVVFENATQKAGFAEEMSSCFPSWFFDFDNDGWLDLCTWNYEFKENLSTHAAREALHPSDDMTGKGYLYHNNQDGTFTNVTKAMGLNQTAFAMGSNFGDIDNDGYLDMYIGTGNPNFESLVPNKLFKNIEGKKFADVTTNARVGNLQKGHGVAFCDLDNDGDQDIFADMGGAFIGDSYPGAFYLNPGESPNHWIYLQLEGTKSNRAAIGAKVTLRFQEKGKSRTVYREVNSGGSFGDSPFRREIGIGQATVIDEIIIHWPATGINQVLKNVNPNQFLKIREGQAEIEPMQLKKLVFKRSNGSIPMCAPGQ